MAISDFQSGYMLGSILIGVILGAIPAYYGAIKGELAIGLIGFVCCIIGFVMFKFLGGLLISIIFVYFVHSASKIKTG